MRPEFKYGLIIGGGVCLWRAAGYGLGFHTTHVQVGGYSDYCSLIIPAVALYLLLRQKQAARPGNRLGVREGMAAGLFTSFLAAVIVYCFLIGYSQFINPGWLDSVLDWKVARWRAQDMPETDIRRQITLYRQARSPLGLIATTVAGPTLVGGLFSAGLTLLIRRGQSGPASRGPS